MGGPGEAAIPAAEYSIGQFGPALRDRDLLLLDQRGTGKSAALRCALFDPQNPAASLRDLYPTAKVERCAKELSAKADLTQYTYTHFARDLEHVRSRLGYGQLNLSGGSYGTRAAQFYLRAYPQNVRTVHFGSVVPLDLATPLTMAKTAEGARKQLFDACDADAACRTAFPNFRKEFAEIVQQLDAGKTPIARGRAAEWFRSRMYLPSVQLHGSAVDDSPRARRRLGARSSRAFRPAPPAQRKRSASACSSRSPATTMLRSSARKTSHAKRAATRSGDYRSVSNKSLPAVVSFAADRSHAREVLRPCTVHFGRQRCRNSAVVHSACRRRLFRARRSRSRRPRAHGVERLCRSIV